MNNDCLGVLSSENATNLSSECGNKCGNNSVCIMRGNEFACRCDNGFEASTDGNGCIRSFQACKVDDDCLKESSCINNQCKFICQDQNACAAGEMCLQNLCMKPCSKYLQCPWNEVCAAGFCIHGCTTDSDCSVHEACIAHQCKGI